MNVIIVILPLILILVLRLKLSSVNKQEKHTPMEEFWAREHDARFARNKDISHIELFTPDVTKLPFSDSPNGELIMLETKVKESALEPMLDLHELSNTDIRITYGPANFPVISKYDQNYMYFTRNLFQWGKHLCTNNQTAQACTVLEYLITLTKDISGAYKLLGNIYKENDEPDKITGLIKIVEESDSFNKQSICNSLRDIINSY